MTRLTAFNRTLAVAGAFVALAAGTTAFAAAPADEAPSVKVSFADLNLSTTEGADALYRRITVAARQVCPDSWSRDLAVFAASKHCQATAIANTVRELNSPQLAMVHAARSSHG